jgi:hypothetical protein
MCGRVPAERAASVIKAYERYRVGDYRDAVAKVGTPCAYRSSPSVGKMRRASHIRPPISAPNASINSTAANGIAIRVYSVTASANRWTRSHRGAVALSDLQDHWPQNFS